VPFDDLEERARQVLRPEVYRYCRQGARDGISAAEATERWDRLRFLPHILRDVTTVETACAVLGTPLRSPVGVAPTTLQRAAHPDGEVATARAAAAAGSLLVLSSNAGSSFQEVADTGVDWWLQLYLTADRPTCRPVLERAVDAGAKAVVLTADTPVVGTKYDEGETVWETASPEWLRANFPADYGSRPQHEKATDLGPQDVEWLARTSGLPVVVKGVLQPVDARRSLDAGAAAIWVSNHGGRQLDGVAATADCIGAVAAEVGEAGEVYVDGGVRSGRHALGALALGAAAVFLGRPVLYALAAEGEHGVRQLLAGMRDELVEVMRLSGCADLDAIGPDILGEPVQPTPRSTL